jgi:hypothetical protein
MQWNHLSEDSKNTETLSSFKRKIRRQAAWTLPLDRTNC